MTHIVRVNCDPAAAVTSASAVDFAQVITFATLIHPTGGMHVWGFRRGGSWRFMVARNGLLPAEDELNAWHSRGWHVYVGMADLRDEPKPGKRGRKTDLALASALWAEVDVKGDDEVKSETLRAINAFVPPPTFVVDSGGGFHCYWLLQTPYYFHTAGHIEEFEARLRWIKMQLGADHCTDVTRMMRVPGTWNWKYNPPRPCRFLGKMDQPDRLPRYCMADFGIERACTSPSSAPEPSVLSELPSYFGIVLERSEQIRNLWEGRGKTSGDTSRSGYDFSLICALIRHGFTSRRFLATVLYHRCRKTGRVIRPGYIARTVARACEVMQNMNDGERS